jgi:cell division protein FtsB
MSFICEFCNNTFTTKNHLSRHYKTESCVKIQKILKNVNNEHIDKIKIIEEQYKLKLSEQENKIKLLTQENNILKTEIKALEKSSEGYRKIVEKAATKSTNTINKNYQHNNYLNYISTEPIKFSNIKNQLKDVVTTKSVMYDDEDFHNHIVDNILKDKDGKDKVLCTDINRKNFTYKDEKSGELISDPELERLREQLKKGTDIKLLRRDLLEKLVIEYEENGSIGIDPYKRFSEIIQKLNFGSPFIDHVAKKTYVKTKNGLEGQFNNETNKESDINDDFFDEEEYKKLYEEFGNEDL